MNITREHVKETTGLVAGLGAGAMTGVVCGTILKAIPNPIVRVMGYVATMGFSVVAGNTAKEGTDQLIDSVCAIVDEIKNR